jgi:signal transduction histidine kinase
LVILQRRLEVALAGDVRVDQSEPIVSAIDELDRLTEFLNTSLDAAEAKTDALRISRTGVDLDELVRVMVALYEPCMSEKALRVQLRSVGSVKVLADEALLHRVIANLLDNELKHLPAACTVSLYVKAIDEGRNFDRRG